MVSRAALLEDVLTLPRLSAGISNHVDGALSALELEALLGDAIESLHGAAAARSEPETTVCSLLPDAIDEILRAISLAMAGGLDRERVAEDGPGGATKLDREKLSSFFYETAVEDVAKGQIEQAIVLLGAMVGMQPGDADALLGLAVCAARLRRYDAALTLALESLRQRPNHPRACCIAGLCELERGDRRAAQHHLAVAARMARRQPGFREELRAAQRLLLMMHIA